MQRLGFAGQLAVLAAVCLVGLLTSRDVAAQGQSQLYAAVTDTNGEPVLDLTADDFGLSIGDTPLTIISAEVDSAPMKVALMVDNGNSIVEANADTALRDALAAFVDTLGAQHEVGVITTLQTGQITSLGASASLAPVHLR